MFEKRLKEYETTNDKVISRFFLINLIVFIPIVYLYYHLNSRDEIINDFNSNKTLTCKTRELILEVSKEDKYSVEGYYFLKGKTKIPVSKCTLKYN